MSITDKINHDIIVYEGSNKNKAKTFFDAAIKYNFEVELLKKSIARESVFVEKFIYYAVIVKGDRKRAKDLSEGYVRGYLHGVVDKIYETQQIERIHNDNT